MKNRSTLSKRRPVPKPVPLPDPPLKSDELIDLFDRSYNKAVDSTGHVVGQTIEALLFLHEAILTGALPENLILHLKDRNVDYSESISAVGEILEIFAGQLHELWNEIDTASCGVRSAMERYRNAHPKPVSA